MVFKTQYHCHVLLFFPPLCLAKILPRFVGIWVLLRFKNIVKPSPQYVTVRLGFLKAMEDRKGGKILLQCHL